MILKKVSIALFSVAGLTLLVLSILELPRSDDERIAFYSGPYLYVTLLLFLLPFISGICAMVSGVFVSVRAKIIGGIGSVSMLLFGYCVVWLKPLSLTMLLAGVEYITIALAWLVFAQTRLPRFDWDDT